MRKQNHQRILPGHPDYYPLVVFLWSNAMSKPEESGLERDYCAGQLSLREMAKIYGISEAAIRKRAKKHGWVRSEKTGTQPGTQVRKKGTQKEKVRTKPKATEKTSENGEVELTVDPDEYGLTLQQAWFVHWCVVSKSRVEAYRLAGYEGTGNTAYVGASRLYRRDNVRRAIRDLQERTAKRYQADLDDLINQLVAITKADPNDLMQYRRVNCRYCWGEGHKYQWRDLGEQLKAEKKAEADNRPPPDLSGGIGFIENMDPNPDCPHCNGEGEGYVHIHDTRDHVGDARFYFTGVKETKFGIEIQTEDKKAARAMLIQLITKLDLNNPASDVPRGLDDFYADIGQSKPESSAPAVLDDKGEE
ncbi:terminase small subunit [Serratia ureilytica]|uniref:terminase small subunit n=1 Tax=Serratia TaxID=613 RepID=UPI001A309170|nr:terminase small subunit [Serratia marcescens]HEJ7159996.1 terminase small subunit [Serratia marcescens]HEM7585976.1 terminase small subunit [Serratia marcescens]